MKIVNGVNYHAVHSNPRILAPLNPVFPLRLVMKQFYQAAWIGDNVAEAAQDHGFPIIRTDGNSIYPRASRLMRWMEQCAQWCSGGWQIGSPRFSHLLNDGRRLFAEVILTENDFFTFQHQLMTVLWKRRDSTLPLHKWLNELRDKLIDDLIGPCRTLQEEAEALAAFIKRTADGGDCSEMALGQFAGQGEGNNCINISTMHSSKGREFSVVIMFGMDEGRIPRHNAGRREHVEARRLFYVGFTRAKVELHIMFSIHRPSPFVIEVQRRLAEGV
jgi:hypothetical protein